MVSQSQPLTDQGRFCEIKRLNKQPNNQVALAVLPWEWQREDRLHILSLALWGLDEANIDLGRRHVLLTMDNVAATVCAMADRWKPVNVMAFIEQDDDGNVVLELDADDSADINARRVLGAIWDRMLPDF